MGSGNFSGSSAVRRDSQKIVHLLHKGMLGRVSLDDAFSDAFAITNGIKQECILGPILFCLFYAAMLDDAIRDLEAGIRTVSELLRSSSAYPD